MTPPDTMRSGLFVRVVRPSPNWPKPLAPIAHRLPSDFTKKVCPFPAAMLVTAWPETERQKAQVRRQKPKGATEVFMSLPRHSCLFPLEQSINGRQPVNPSV